MYCILEYLVLLYQEPLVNHLCGGHNDGTCLFSRSRATTNRAIALPKLLIGAGFDWLAPAQPVQLIEVNITWGDDETKCLYVFFEETPRLHVGDNETLCLIIGDMETLCLLVEFMETFGDTLSPRLTNRDKVSLCTWVSTYCKGDEETLCLHDSDEETLCLLFVS